MIDHSSGRKKYHWIFQWASPVDLDFSISKNGSILSLPRISFHFHYTVLVKKATNAERILQNMVLFVFVSRQLSNAVSHSYVTPKRCGRQIYLIGKLRANLHMEIHKHQHTKLVFHTHVALMQSDCELEMYIPEYLEWLFWCIASCRQTLRFELVVEPQVKSNLNLKENNTMKGFLYQCKQ